MTSQLERYAIAERLLPHQWKDLVLPGRVKPNWIGGSDSFWYVRRTEARDSFMLTHAASGTRAPAFDHSAMAHALSLALERPVASGDLPISGLELRDNEEPIRVHVEGRTWTWHAPTSTITLAPEPAPDRFRDSISPDGRWAVVVRDHNLVLLERATGVERPLTNQGVEAHSFGTPPDVHGFRFMLEQLGLQMAPVVAWSPDSRRLVTHRIDQRTLPLMHYLQTTPPDRGRPRLYSQRYAMVGEEAVPAAELVVIDVESADLTWAACHPVLTPYWSPITRRHVWWARDGRHVYFVCGTRGDRMRWLYELDPDTGRVRRLVEETSNTQVQVHPLEFSPPNVEVLTTGEVVWWSERSGWGHLHLYTPDGCVRPLTSGEWLVRDLVCVDEDARTVTFSAAGREADLDPYVRQLYQVPLEGGTVQRLTCDKLDHDATGSPSGRYVVDVTSWIDTPERSYLLDGAGAVIMELEEANAERLYEAGWTPPERFRVRAADGFTDIYGLLYRPRDFDAARRYPVLDDIYPGPQLAAASVRFCERGAADHAASMAALGFAVVVIDGRGTPLRSKAFQEHCRARHVDENLDDHVAAIRQLASAYPWLDLDRVGIYGNSGGGRASTMAMLRHSDFFKVAVSASGDHDDLFFRASWGEKYVAIATDHEFDALYASRATATYAAALRGRLLLIHGELDDNVPPSQTLRLVDALIAANKDFDLLIIPNADHMLAVHQPYWLRRRWDYFVRHLLDIEPPEYQIADIPVDLAPLVEFIAG